MTGTALAVTAACWALWPQKAKAEKARKELFSEGEATGKTAAAGSGAAETSTDASTNTSGSDGDAKA